MLEYGAAAGSLHKVQGFGREEMSARAKAERGQARSVRDQARAQQLPPVVGEEKKGMNERRMSCLGQLVFKLSVPN